MWEEEEEELDDVVVVMVDSVQFSVATIALASVTKQPGAGYTASSGIW